jgi:hypothetical protein
MRFTLARMTLLLLVLGAISAWAGPPYLTDDPEIPPPNGWEINVPFILERIPGETDFETPLFDINYGTPTNWVIPHVQLKLEIPVALVAHDHAGLVGGFGDMLVGVKWPFLEEQGWRPLVGIYPQLLVPTGSQSRGLGEGKTGWAFPLLAEKNWGKWTLYGNVGFVLQNATDQRNYWYEGICLNRMITDTLQLGVEIVENSPPPTEGYHNLAFNVGGSWKMSNHLNLLFSGGRSIYGETDYMAYFGIQFELGSAPPEH